MKRQIKLTNYKTNEKIIVNDPKELKDKFGKYVDYKKYIRNGHRVNGVWDVEFTRNLIINGNPIPENVYKVVKNINKNSFFDIEDYPSYTLAVKLDIEEYLIQEDMCTLSDFDEFYRFYGFENLKILTKEVGGNWKLKKKSKRE